MSGHHGLYELGYICATKVVIKRYKNVSFSKTLKSNLSSDCFLQHENMKVESLVIVYQHGTVNSSGPSTHRPSRGRN